MSKKKKKFKIRYIVLIILLVLVAAGGTIVAKNWDTIQAAKVGLTSTPEEIQAQQEAKKAELEKELGLEGGFTEEEMNSALAEVQAILGDSVDGIVAAETGEGTGTGTAGDGGNTATSGEGTPVAQNTADAIVRKYTAQLYALEGSFSGRISSLAASAKSEYLALPEEQRTSSAKASIVSSKISQGEALEGECDAAVNAVLSNMTSELNAIGADTGVVSQLRDYYESEKASQMAAAMAAMRQ